MRNCFVFMLFIGLACLSSCTSNDTDSGTGGGVAAESSSEVAEPPRQTEEPPATTTTTATDNVPVTEDASMSCPADQKLFVQQLDVLEEFKTMVEICPHATTSQVIKDVKQGRQLASHHDEPRSPSSQESKSARILPAQVGEKAEVFWFVNFPSNRDNFYLIQGKFELVKKWRHPFPYGRDKIDENNPAEVLTSKMDFDHYLPADYNHYSSEDSENDEKRFGSNSTDFPVDSGAGPQLSREGYSDGREGRIFYFSGNLDFRSPSHLKKEHPENFKEYVLANYDTDFSPRFGFPFASPKNSFGAYDLAIHSLMYKNFGDVIQKSSSGSSSSHSSERKKPQPASMDEVMAFIRLSQQGNLYFYQSDYMNWGGGYHPSVHRYYRITFSLMGTLTGAVDGADELKQVLELGGPKLYLKAIENNFGSQDEFQRLAASVIPYYSNTEITSLFQTLEWIAAIKNGRRLPAVSTTSRYAIEPSFKRLLDEIASNIGMDVNRLGARYLGHIAIPYEIVDGGSYNHDDLFFRMVTHGQIGPRRQKPDPNAPNLKEISQGAKIQITLPKAYLEYAKSEAVPLYIPSGGYVDLEAVKNELLHWGAVIEPKQYSSSHYLIFKMKPDKDIPDEGFRYFAYTYALVDDTPESIIAAKQYYTQADYQIDHNKIPPALDKLIKSSMVQELNTPEFLKQAARYFDGYPYTKNDEKTYNAYRDFFANEQDPRGLVEAFFDIQKADCDLFNGVLARVLRHRAGLPVRMVMGYTSTYNPQQGRGSIHLGNPMHEWVEVLLRTQDGKHAWVPFDATSTWVGGEKKTVDNWLPAPEVLARLKGVQFEKVGEHPIYIRLKQGLIPLSMTVTNMERQDGAPTFICSSAETNKICVPHHHDEQVQKYLESL